MMSGVRRYLTSHAQREKKELVLNMEINMAITAAFRLVASVGTECREASEKINRCSRCD